MKAKASESSIKAAFQTNKTASLDSLTQMSNKPAKIKPNVLLKHYIYYGSGSFCFIFNILCQFIAVFA